MLRCVEKVDDGRLDSIRYRAEFKGIEEGVHLTGN